MKIKFEDLQRVMKKLEKHSKKGDIELSIKPYEAHILRISYVSNIDTETLIEVFDSDLNKFVTINESKWLE